MSPHSVQQNEAQSACSESTTKELFSAEKTSHKHNEKDSSRLQQFSTGMPENTKYIHSASGTYTKEMSPVAYIYGQKNKNKKRLSMTPVHRTVQERLSIVSCIEFKV